MKYTDKAMSDEELAKKLEEAALSSELGERLRAATGLPLREITVS